MTLNEIPLEDFVPGIKFRTLTGKIATVARADSRPGHFETYGPSSNGATFDGDDAWFFFDIEGEDWWGHGCYHHHIPPVEIISLPQRGSL